MQFQKVRRFSTNRQEAHGGTGMWTGHRKFPHLPERLALKTTPVPLEKPSPRVTHVGVSLEVA